MTFSSAIWLIALLPWAAVVLWLLSGKRQPAHVPFLELWRGPVHGPRVRAALHIPPIALVCLMAAMLLAIVAAARPRLTFLRSGDGPHITLIIDRGFTLSARGEHLARWQELIQSAAPAITEHFGEGPTDLVLVPDGQVQSTTRSNWLAMAQRYPSTTTDTRDLLRTCTRRILRRFAGPIVVFSDQPLRINDSRVIQIAPSVAARNVGIVFVAARQSPAPQIMVRVRNDSDLTRATVSTLVANQQIRKSIDLPPPGGEANFFLDPADLGATAQIELQADDDQPADNSAILRRRQSWPKIEPAGELPAEVRRMIQTYQRLRSASSDSTPVAVTTHDPGLDVPAIILSSAAASLPQSLPLRVQDHPVNANVDWSGSVGSVLVSPLPPGQWQPIVWAGDHVLVAVREAPVRQVWIGFTSPAWPRTSNFVVFWTNALDWAGQGASIYDAQFVPAVPIPARIATDWRGKLAAIHVTGQRQIDLAPLLVVAALTLTLGAAVLWPGAPGGELP